MTPTKVHPATKAFPMFSDEEIQALAENIKVNGLIHPIVTDAEGTIIDGRNRLKACEIAGVTPTFEQIGERDPLAFIVSANLNRRNLSKGQQAMAFAMIYPEAEYGGKREKGSSSVSELAFSKVRLSVARQVLRANRELAEAVRDGYETLDDALIKVKTQKQSEEEHRRQLLLTLELTIEPHIKAYIEIGIALRNIRDNRLHRDTHDNFDDYCLDQWGLSKTNTDLCIDFASWTQD